MDGKGYWSDNVFVERLRQTIKYEEVYLLAYFNASEARTRLTKYIDFYNRRDHTSPFAEGQRIVNTTSRCRPNRLRAPPKHHL